MMNQFCKDESDIIYEFKIEQASTFVYIVKMNMKQGPKKGVKMSIEKKSTKRDGE